MQLPDLNKTKDDEEVTNIFNGPAATQLIGCVHCAMMGMVENPDVIYHYAGSSYCLDHLMGVSAAQQ